MKDKIKFLADRDHISVPQLLKRTSRELYTHLILYVGFIILSVIGYSFGISIVNDWKIASFFIVTLSIGSILLITILSIDHIFNIIFNHEKYIIKVLEREYDDIFG